jgi:hypothetical protein
MEILTHLPKTPMPTDTISTSPTALPADSAICVSVDHVLHARPKNDSNMLLPMHPLRIGPSAPRSSWTGESSGNCTSGALVRRLHCSTSRSCGTTGGAIFARCRGTGPLERFRAGGACHRFLNRYACGLTRLRLLGTITTCGVRVFDPSGGQCASDRTLQRYYR